MVCDTHYHEPVLHDYYGTACETTFQTPQPGRPLTVRLAILTDEVRLRYAPGEGVPDVQTPMVVSAFSGPRRFRVVETEVAVVLETAALRLGVVGEPWQLKVCDRKGTLVFATKPVDIEPLRRPEHQWNPAEQRWLFLHRYAYPLGVTAEGPPKVFASFDLAHNERVYGFGESYGKLDKMGTQGVLWLQEAFSNAAPAAYKQTPFFMSTRGYGLFVNTSNALRYFVGSLEHPDDPTAAFIDDQFYFGRNLLVAPIMSEQNARRIYLPHRHRVDYWRKEVLTGRRWLEVEAPLDTVPMYVRAGAVLPYGPLVQYVDETPYNPLTLELYLPEGEGAYVVHDQGRPDLPVRYRRDGGTLTVEIGAAPSEVVLTLFGASIREAQTGERPLGVEHARTVRFDGRAPQTVRLGLE